MIYPPDWLWPNDHGKVESPPPDLGLISNSQPGHMDFIERELRDAEAREAARDQSVQSRLTAVLGFSSTLASLTSAALGFAATSTPMDLSRVQLGAVIAGLSYVGVQFIAAMFNSAAGLLPRTFSELDPAKLEPTAGESPDAFRLEFVSTKRANLVKARWATNRRMDQMTKGVRAVRNAAAGAVILLAIALLITLNRRFGLFLPLP